MPYSALEPVSDAVVALLNVAALTGLATLTGDPEQGGSLPMVWLELVNERDMRGFGTGALPEIELRVHVFSKYEGAKEAQTIARKVVELLKDKALSVSGWTQAGLIFIDEVVSLSEENLLGQKVRELVVMGRIYVES